MYPNLSVLRNATDFVSAFPSPGVGATNNVNSDLLNHNLTNIF